MQATQALYSNHLLPVAICIDRVARVQYAVWGLAGIEQHDLKELTRAYVAYTVECSY